MWYLADRRNPYNSKSQIAIEYAYQIRERKPETWVFWVHASNAARYEQSFRAIANLVKLPDRHNIQINIFQLVHDWLQSSKSGSWLMVLDNVDDAGFLLEAPHISQAGSLSDSVGETPSPLVSYLPFCPHGSLLITSRRRAAALQLVEDSDIVDVEPMSQEDAVALIRKKLKRPGKPDMGVCLELVNTLATTLDCMPLAIVQATSYILQRAPRCSVQRYLEMFEQSDKAKTSLLDFEAGQLRRDREAKNSVFLTWQISFDYIRKARASAADLLSLMCYCDRQGIPESLLRRISSGCVEVEQEMDLADQLERVELLQDGGPVAKAPSSAGDDDFDPNSGDGFEDDLLFLRDFAFVSIREDGLSFDMHRLVQLATRKWVERHQELERWQGMAVEVVANAFPNGNYENWEICDALLPHAQKVLLNPQLHFSLLLALH